MKIKKIVLLLLALGLVVPMCEARKNEASSTGYHRKAKSKSKKVTKKHGKKSKKASKKGKKKVQKQRKRRDARAY